MADTYSACKESDKAKRISICRYLYSFALQFILQHSAVLVHEHLIITFGHHNQIVNTSTSLQTHVNKQMLEGSITIRVSTILLMVHRSILGAVAPSSRGTHSGKIIHPLPSHRNICILSLFPLFSPVVFMF